MSNIFKKRIAYKPFEYPFVQEFIDKINQTFWVHKEVDFSADMQDFYTKLKPEEQEILLRSALAIAQVEVTVKEFWGKLYEHLPKPEFNDLGATVSENEVRHSQAYSRVLEVLNLDERFEKLLEVPVFSEKLKLINTHFHPTFDFIHKLFFFTIVIENASLFSQFANFVAMDHHRGIMKNMANMVKWSISDEDIHRLAGEAIINQIFAENPEMRFSQEYVTTMVTDYIKYEENLLNWIFEEGELPEYSKEDLLNFMKFRIDESLHNMGYDKIFYINSEQHKPMIWFDEFAFSTDMDDFFAKRPTAYTKHDKPITENDLF